jgi:hypothetical protein
MNSNSLVQENLFHLCLVKVYGLTNENKRYFGLLRDCFIGFSLHFPDAFETAHKSAEVRQLLLKVLFSYFKSREATAKSKD